MNLFDVYPLFDVNIVKGKGCHVWDDKGQEYLDLYGGHAVISVGHCHPHYIEKLTRQLGRLGFYSNSVVNKLQVELAERLGKACGYEEGKKLENLPADWQLRAYAPNEQGWYTSGKVYVNVWNYDAHWGPVYYSDSGKTKVAISKDKTHDGYANSLYEQYKDQYTVLAYTTTPHMFSIEPSEGATSATIETTDRFGNRYSASVSW